MKNKLLTSRPLWHDGLFITRVFAAIMILPYGRELFNATSMNDLTGFLSSIHFPLPKPMAYLAKITELVGGICLGLGLFTRIVTVPLIICMVVVIYTMGGGSIFNDQAASLFLFLFLSFFLAGPGKWSLDYWLFDRKRKLINQNA